jgi:hypothetical protein
MSKKIILLFLLISVFFTLSAKAQQKKSALKVTIEAGVLRVKKNCHISNNKFGGI